MGMATPPMQTSTTPPFLHVILLEPPVHVPQLAPLPPGQPAGVPCGGRGSPELLQAIATVPLHAGLPPRSPQAEAAVGCEGRLVPVRVTACPPHGLILRQRPDILASPVARLGQQEARPHQSRDLGGADDERDRRLARGEARARGPVGR